MEYHPKPPSAPNIYAKKAEKQETQDFENAEVVIQEVFYKFNCAPLQSIFDHQEQNPLFAREYKHTHMEERNPPKSK